MHLVALKKGFSICLDQSFLTGQNNCKTLFSFSFLSYSTHTHAHTHTPTHTRTHTYATYTHTHKLQAGANMIVSGSAVVNNPDPADVITKLRETVQKYLN